MPNEEHLRYLVEGGVGNWNDWRSTETARTNLSGTDFHSLFKEAREEDQQGRIPFSGIDFSNTSLFEANLTDADLSGANLTNAFLGKADLTNVEFWDAELSGANFNGASVDNAHFERTDLAQASFAGTKLWQAILYRNTNEIEQRDIKFRPINSIAGLLIVIRKLKQEYPSNALFYFRGESEDAWELRPSIMRTGLREILEPHESDMLRELISRRPDDFNHIRSALGEWVLAQHHGLKTRFLDILRNPLVGLFFASRYNESIKDISDGKLHIFVVPSSLVKSYNSDTVSVITNFAKLTNADQQMLLGKTNAFSNRPYHEAMGRLYQLIQTEKPYFINRIDPRDLYRVLIVEPQRSVERIRAQTGAFLVSAFHERFEREKVLELKPDLPIYAHHIMTVPGRRKSRIRNELELLNITRETMLPGLDTAAEVITEAYGGGAVI